MRIVTPRLVLRPARADDAPALFAMYSDPVFMRYWASLPHASLEETREHLARVMARPEEESFEFLIEYQGRMIGRAGVHAWPEVGYGVIPEFWGQGLASEAISAVIERAFQLRPDVLELTASVDPRNTASIRLLEKLGFRLTSVVKGDFPLGDEWLDSAYFALSRPDS